MDIFTKLADAGEEAIAKLTEAPGADRMLGTVTSMRDRVDEIQRRLRGLDELERRVAELERRVDAVAPAKAKPAGSPSASNAATSKSSTRSTGSGSPG